MHHALISCQRAIQLWQDLRQLILAIAGTNIPIRLEKNRLRETSFAEAECYPKDKRPHPTLAPPTDPSLTPIPFPTTPSNLPVRVPFPVLSDLDPDEDIVPSTLPRPSVSSTPSSHHQSSFEPVVALDGCTTGNNDVPMVCPSQPRNPSPTQLTSNPSETQPSSPIHQSSPEPPVALNGCTDGDGNGCLFPNSPTTASQNPFIIPPPLADTSFLTSTVPPSHPDNANNHHAHPPTSSQDNCDKSFQNRWSSVFSSNSTWQEFSEQCYEFTEDLIKTSNDKQPKKKSYSARRPHRPSARPVNVNRAPLRYNPREAKKIQTLYRLSKKRAARKVLNDNLPSYSGSTDDANTFFLWRENM
jgi:hypothetical protein